jgi:hypothetical protein
MSLQERLDRIRQGFEKQAPPEAVVLMHRVADDLRDSGIKDRALKEGHTAPSFELEDSHGRRVNLSGLLAQGPVVLTFFRGHW